MAADDLIPTGDQTTPNYRGSEEAPAAPETAPPPREAASNSTTQGDTMDAATANENANMGTGEAAPQPVNNGAAAGDNSVKNDATPGEEPNMADTQAGVDALPKDAGPSAKDDTTPGEGDGQGNPEEMEAANRKLNEEEYAKAENDAAGPAAAAGGDEEDDHPDKEMLDGMNTPEPEEAEVTEPHPDDDMLKEMNPPEKEPEAVRDGEDPDFDEMEAANNAYLEGEDAKARQDEADIETKMAEEDELSRISQEEINSGGMPGMDAAAPEAPSGSALEEALGEDARIEEEEHQKDLDTENEMRLGRGEDMTGPGGDDDDEKSVKDAQEEEADIENKMAEEAKPGAVTPGTAKESPDAPDAGGTAKEGPVAPGEAKSGAPGTDAATPKDSPDVAPAPSVPKDSTEPKAGPKEEEPKAESKPGPKAEEPYKGAPGLVKPAPSTSGLTEKQAQDYINGMGSVSEKNRDGMAKGQALVGAAQNETAVLNSLAEQQPDMLKANKKAVDNYLNEMVKREDILKQELDKLVKDGKLQKDDADKIVQNYEKAADKVAEAAGVQKFTERKHAADHAHDAPSMGFGGVSVTPSGKETTGGSVDVAYDKENKTVTVTTKDKDGKEHTNKIEGVEGVVMDGNGNTKIEGKNGTLVKLEGANVNIHDVKAQSVGAGGKEQSAGKGA